jgi:hypothetical protein
MEQYYTSPGTVTAIAVWALRARNVNLSARRANPVPRNLPEIELANDNVEKPAAIQKFIGRCPIAAFGNPDGDLEMLLWTAAGTGARFALLVHHNDAIREFAYDGTPSIG